MEHWVLRNASDRPDLSAVGRLLVSYHNEGNPNGNHAGIKKAYLEFWESAESLRANLTIPDRWRVAYATSSLNVPPMGECLSFTEIASDIVCVGSDAAPTAIAAVDHTHALYTVFWY